MSECRRSGRGAVWSLLLVACAADDAAPPPSEGGKLEPGVAATVGGAAIELSLVRAVSAERSISPREAAAALVHDAVLAERLEEEDEREARYVRRTVLARKLVESFLEQAKAAGPPTEEEVAEFTRRHWWVLDRPPAARVVHAVVVCQECDDPTGARALAQSILEATAGIEDPELFIETAKQVESGEFEVVAQELQPVAADGRVVLLNATPNANFEFGRYNEAFATAANALGEVGEHSDVVQSPSGFHVMVLLEKQAGKRLAYRERAELLTNEILSARARELQRAVVERARAAQTIEVERSFDRDTQLLLEEP